MNTSFAQRFDLQSGRHVLKFDANARVSASEKLQYFDQDFIYATGHTKGKVTDLAFPGLGRHSRKMINLAEYLVCFSNDSFSCGRQTNFALRPLKQSNAEFFFELPDLLAERRLTDVQAYRRATEVKFFGDRYKVTQVSQFHR